MRWACWIQVRVRMNHVTHQRTQCSFQDYAGYTFDSLGKSRSSFGVSHDSFVHDMPHLDVMRLILMVIHLFDDPERSVGRRSLFADYRAPSQTRLQGSFRDYRALFAYGIALFEDNRAFFSRLF